MSHSLSLKPFPMSFLHAQLSYDCSVIPTQARPNQPSTLIQVLLLSSSVPRLKQIPGWAMTSVPPTPRRLSLIHKRYDHIQPRAQSRPKRPECEQKTATPPSSSSANLSMEQGVGNLQQATSRTLNVPGCGTSYPGLDSLLCYVHLRSPCMTYACPVRAADRAVSGVLGLENLILGVWEGYGRVRFAWVGGGLMAS
ncbi:predicted protein [Plenodomus lingam JN3]|uniref:Predicted protein n=1 Tax=Leptosphaeria maculans (strain JN3 / isolate v23.1.3 / race Av1-4-5-6-7-8) TaxID=985895 RepID=E5R4X3_LEPMJ|nr:predicted protein [Plenodomus lingam JN3]CBX92246.1 predicted protein [Plenodomus lingam JN3]